MAGSATRLTVEGAREHFLRDLDCVVPHDTLTVVTGVSGSGKSSLVFDTICREGQRRFLATLSLHARGFLGQLHQPACRRITGLRPTLAVGQGGRQANLRSTVGTFTDLYDGLRMLFARLGETPCPTCFRPARAPTCTGCRGPLPPLRAALFSFNGPLGACPVCDGLGVEDAIDPALLVGDPARSLREGALVLTTPKPYIIYSQVTMEVLDQVCRAHGFSIDVPWQALTDEQRRVVLFGSDRLKVPFGKHPLESRLKWKGITARPRDEGFYEGIVPTMTGILKRDRNPNILRFVRSRPCVQCGGRRLGPAALAVRLAGRGIAEVSALPLRDLRRWLAGLAGVLPPRDAAVAAPVVAELTARLERLTALGLDHLTVDRPSPSLSAGEWQRIRLALLAFGPLQGLLYVLDEPSLGLHPRDQEELLDLLLTLRDRGNTVIAVEHRRAGILAADWLLDLGPGAGPAGGRLLFAGPPAELLGAAGPAESATRAWLAGAPEAPGSPGLSPGDAHSEASRVDPSPTMGDSDPLSARGAAAASCRTEPDRRISAGDAAGSAGLARCGGADVASDVLPARVPPMALTAPAWPRLEVLGATLHNLRGLDVTVPLQALVAVCGVSGAGKTTLVEHTIARYLTWKLHSSEVVASKRRDDEAEARHEPAMTAVSSSCREIRGLEHLDRVICLDQRPIGRTPRSNPATYTGLFDLIRKRFAALPAARELGLGQGHFSTNVAGGRCEACAGSGHREIGLHLLPPVTVECEECHGRRYLPKTLSVRLNGCAIDEVLAMTVEEAAAAFLDDPPVLRILAALHDVGLGYLPLGQPSTTLSGGEAQRVKLAAELARVPQAPPGRRSARTSRGGDGPGARWSAAGPRPGRSGVARVLYLLDEPATGLHHADIVRLLAMLRRLVAHGHSVLAVEHHPEFLLAADWLIEMGPGGGDAGGRMVVAGPPPVVAACVGSPTGAALARLLGGDDRVPCPRSRRAAPAAAIELAEVGTHNLQIAEVSFPHQALTVVTGVSGSGKSSLVLGTLWAESQQRYLASLSAYARRFMALAERPVLGRATGLTPTVAIGARRGAPAARSTVGTVSGALDLLRLLWSRLGFAVAPPGAASGAASPWSGATVGREGADDRQAGAGMASATGGRGRRCGLPASHFSFNRVEGACPRCHGLGSESVCEPDRLVTDPTRSLLDGALDGTRTGRFYGERHGQYVATLAAVGETLGFDFRQPWLELPAPARAVAMHGCGDRVFHVEWAFRRGKRSGRHRLETAWPGFCGLVAAEFARKRADARGEAMAEVMVERRCGECQGDRLRAEVAAITWQELSLPAACRLPLTTLTSRVKTWLTEPVVAAADAPIAAPLLRELLPRLETLVGAGLGYLSLDRDLRSLSGGEHRRLLLASSLTGELGGVTYLLDEPTVGLHARDVGRLLEVLRQLRDRGNTVIVIEHDPAVIAAADRVIEIGPGAGAEGGRIVGSGARGVGITARWLAPDAPWPVLPAHALRHPGLAIVGATANNLRDLEVAIPLGGLVVIAGVSGSGKSTLVEEVLIPSLRAGRAVGCRAFASSVRDLPTMVVDQLGFEGSEGSVIVTAIDALPAIGKLFAATAAARSAGLKPAAFSPFSPVGRCRACEGRGGDEVSLDFLAGVHLVCETCEGSRLDPSVLACRYRDRTLADVLAAGVDAAADLFADQPAVMRRLDPLRRLGLGHLPLGRTTASLSAGERQRLRLACALADAAPERRRAGSAGPARSAKNAGDATEGGAKGGAVRDQGGILFVFDEPTAGLHLADVARLLEVFGELVAAGHSVLVVEHHLELIRRADWVIELGPGGGDAGGTLVVAGPPPVVAAHPTSATGAALREASLPVGEGPTAC